MKKSSRNAASKRGHSKSIVKNNFSRVLSGVLENMFQKQMIKWQCMMLKFFEQNFKIILYYYSTIQQIHFIEMLQWLQPLNFDFPNKLRCNGISIHKCFYIVHSPNQLSQSNHVVDFSFSLVSVSEQVSAVACKEFVSSSYLTVFVYRELAVWLNEPMLSLVLLPSAQTVFFHVAFESNDHFHRLAYYVPVKIKFFTLIYLSTVS